MIPDIVKDTLLWFLRDYGAYIAMGIVTLLAAGAVLGSIKSLLGSLFTLAFKAGDELSKKAATNRPLVVVAALGLAAFLWFRPVEKMQRSIEPSGPASQTFVTAPVKVGATPQAEQQPPTAAPRHRILSAGERLNLMCPNCHGFMVAIGTGDSDRSTCPQCNAPFFADDAERAYLDFVTANSPVPEGKPIWCKCVKCGDCYTILGDGSTLQADCPKCKFIIPVADASKAHASCNLKHETYTWHYANGPFQEPKTKEGKLRLELAKHGMEPPDGWRGEEYRAWDEFQKTHVGPGGPRNWPVSLILRELWNDFQRSLPPNIIKQYLNGECRYSTLYMPPTEQERIEFAAEREEFSQRLALAKSGIEIRRSHMDETPAEQAAIKEFNKDFEGLSVSDQKYEILRNRQIAAVNTWNTYQATLPGDERYFLDARGIGIEHQPDKFKMIPVNDEERLDASVASARVTLACYEILFPDATPEEKGVYDSLFKPENTELLSQFRGNTKARQEYFQFWNHFQDRLKPTKRTFYITKDGKLIKQSP